MSLYEYSSVLVNAGFRTVVVEQVERVGEMNKGQGRKSDAVVKREACQVGRCMVIPHGWDHVNCALSWSEKTLGGGHRELGDKIWMSISDRK